MSITGNNILLRAIEERDLQYLNGIANDDEIQYMLGGWRFPVNMNDQLIWFKTLNCNSMNQRFVIENHTKKVIGTANLININMKDGNAELGLIVDKNYQGKGFGQAVVEALSNYAFRELRLNRLETSIISYNKPSLHLFIKKCGWTVEGELRDWYYRKGEFHNKIMLSILKKEFIAS